MAAVVEDWESVVAERAAERSGRRLRTRAMIAVPIVVVTALVVVALTSRTRPPANEAHAAIVEAPALHFVAELRGLRGPSDRVTGVVDFGSGFGLVESRRTNHLGDGWEEATFPTLGWDDDRVIYLRDGHERSAPFDGVRTLFFVEQLMASTPALLAQAHTVADNRDETGTGPLRASVSADVSERLGISSIPLSIGMDMAEGRLEALRIQWESIDEPGGFISVSVDFGAAATVADVDMSIFSDARVDPSAE